MATTLILPGSQALKCGRRVAFPNRLGFPGRRWPELSPCSLPLPAGLREASLWPAVLRGVGRRKPCLPFPGLLSHQIGGRGAGSGWRGHTLLDGVTETVKLLASGKSAAHPAVLTWPSLGPDITCSSLISLLPWDQRQTRPSQMLGPATSCGQLKTCVSVDWAPYAFQACGSFVVLRFTLCVWVCVMCVWEPVEVRSGQVPWSYPMRVLKPEPYSLK